MRKNGMMHIKASRLVRIVVLCFMLVCHSTNVNSESDTNVVEPCSYYEEYSSEEEQQVAKKILEGDIESYNEYKIRGDIKSYYFYAVIMAKKYNYPPAFFDAFEAMTKVYEKYDLNMDTCTWHYAFSYLETGIQLNSWECASALEYLYLRGNDFVSIDTAKAMHYKQLTHRFMKELREKNKKKIGVSFEQ